MSRFVNLVVIVNVVLLLLIGIRLWDPLPVQIVRTSIFDLYQRLEPRTTERLPVTIIDIDEKSLDEQGQWPWPRHTLTQLLEKLAIAQPLVVGFDTVFPEPDRLSPSTMLQSLAEQTDIRQLESLTMLDSDEMFAEVISRQPVVLGTMLSPEQKQRQHSPLLPEKFSYTDDPTPYLPFVEGRLANLSDYESKANGVGVLTLLPEPDGVVRRVPTVFRIGDSIWPSLGVELLRIALKAETITINVDKAGIDSLLINGISIPTNEKGLTWVHFNEHQPERFVSATDVLNDRINLDSFNGHIVLIGASAGGLHDIKMTPMAQQMSGVEIWAQWLESSLFGRLLQRPNYIFIGEMLFVFMVGQLLIFLTLRARARTSLLVFLGLVFSSGLFSWWLYTEKAQLFDFSFPLLSVGMLFALLMYMKFYKEEQQRKQIRNAFSHYLSPSIVDELSRNPEKLKLGGEVRTITSLFTDLEGFTLLSESFDAEQLVDLINQYLDGICHLVIQHEGTVDKIIGDAVHAIFGAPQYSKKHAQQAIQCALAIEDFSQEFREQQLARGYQLGLTRIGINSGEAIVGNFGGEVRFDYTAYGDTVNTASRLESANQFIGTSICVAKATVELYKQQLFRPIAQLSVKGKSELINVFEPIRVSSQKQGYLEKYLQAFSLLEKKDPSAHESFMALARQFPNDRVIKKHLEKMKGGEYGVQWDITS